MKIPFQVTKRLRTLLALDFLRRLQYLSEKDKIYLRDKPGCDVSIWDISFDTLPQQIAYRSALPSEIGAHYYSVPENAGLMGFKVYSVVVEISDLGNQPPYIQAKGEYFPLATTREEANLLMTGLSSFDMNKPGKHSEYMFIPLDEKDWKQADGMIQFKTESIFAELEPSSSFNIPAEQFNELLDRKEAQQ